MKAAYGGPAPEELVDAWMCKFFGCLPSQLDEEPADRVYELFRAYHLYEEYAAKKRGG